MPTEIKIAKFETPTELGWADCCKCGARVTVAAAYTGEYCFMNVCIRTQEGLAVPLVYCEKHIPTRVEDL
jgi:hypothetical protein